MEKENNDWPVRDHVPVNRDPIGDVEPENKHLGSFMYNAMTEEEQQKLLEEFEKMLNETQEDQEDFGFFDPSYPSYEDLEYPEFPPVIEKKGEEKKECEHENKYLNKPIGNMQYWYCPDCKEEVDG